jgi:4-carboxymuconolactone decarboxylase
MTAWLCNAELARRGQKLGELLRFDTGFDAALTEIAILTCARHWTSHHEWTAHKKLALQAGVSSGSIADIAAGRQPDFGDEKQAMIHRLSSTILKKGKLTQPLYDEGIAMFGERCLVELTAILGYYCLVSLPLNVFELGLPENIAAELNGASSDREAP